MVERLGDVTDVDVLIIGGGIAGSLAAIKARETGQRVALVEKANLGRSGVSHQMSGVLTCFDPRKDDAAKWYSECIEASLGLSDQDRLKNMVEETYDRIIDLERWGVKFQKEDGEFIRVPGAGHKHARNVLMTQGGYQLMAVVRGEVLRRGVQLIERVMVTDLLTSDDCYPTNGATTGAVGFNIRTGKFHIFQAKATVCANGEARTILVHEPMVSLTGDGMAMAFRVGCEIRSVELSKISYIAKDFGVLGANILLGEGAVLVNARGERFMAKWDPERLERAPKSVSGRAMAIEELEGRGPVYLDATHLSDAAYRRIEMAIPRVINVLAKGGLNLRKDRVEWTIQLTGQGPGGIRVDARGATAIPGLFAAGAVTDFGEDGVINIITHGMASAIGGRRAGNAAAMYALECEAPAINTAQVRELKERIFAPLKRKKGIPYSQASKECSIFRQEGLVGAVRNEGRLKRATEVAQRIQKEVVPQLTATDYHELAKVLGLRNALLYVDLIARCALHRTESRGSHYREDFPHRDDANWLKWVIAKKVNDGVRVFDEAVPA